ncbi:hypothetical protein VTN77DRAFT_2540 [Rasamsonia byssochlamydoides]|uniref:uncharacterized protein n=1 Tax=Rasamsonia byssochlamydoides TaxID=89139 RepID=UPI0037436D87
MLLGIELEDPVLPRQLDRLRVLLHLLPVRLVPHVARRLACFLHLADAVVAVSTSEGLLLTESPDTPAPRPESGLYCLLV